MTDCQVDLLPVPATNSTSSGRGLAERGLRGLLMATIVVPALTFVSATREGRLIFVMYREPKLAAIQILGWLFLVLWCWHRVSNGRPILGRSLGQPVVGVVILFVAYLALSGLWGRVFENYLYEISQYILLLFLFLVLVQWGSESPGLRRLIIGSLVVSLALVSLVGVIQLMWRIPYLEPIDPGLGVEYPSLMGYKNPMALSLLGQIFLLAYLVFERPVRPGRGANRMRLLAAVVLALELFYLAILLSRAAYTGFVLTAPPLVILLLIRALREQRLARTAIAMVLLGAVTGGALFLVPAAAERFSSIGDNLAAGLEYLESDRSTYALNTLNMAKHRPFGVGLGDWQTFYPLYRVVGRYTVFDELNQVRRAHSDHVQYLGETGWQGLALWLAVLAVFIGSAIKRFRAGSVLPLFAAAQVLCVAAAGTIDYIMELPYNKFQFFLVLAVIAIRPGSQDSVCQGSKRTLFFGQAMVVTLLGVFCASLATSTLVRGYSSAGLREAYTRLQGSDDAAEKARLVDEVAARGRTFQGLVGHDKTFHKDFLILAHIAYLKGDHDHAVALVERSLELHPYYPNAFKLLGRILWEVDRDQAELYFATYSYIMDQTEAGFKRVYPIPGG